MNTHNNALIAFRQGDVATAWLFLSDDFKHQTSLDPSVIDLGVTIVLAMPLADSEQRAAVTLLAPWVAQIDDVALKIRFCNAIRQHGTDLQKQGDYQGALQLWQALIQIAPRQMEVWRDIAECFRRQGLWSEERHALEKALEQAPNDLWLLFFYGYVLEHSHDYDGVFAAHQKAFENHSDIPEAISAFDGAARHTADWDQVDKTFSCLRALPAPTKDQAPFEQPLQVVFRYDDDFSVNKRIAAWASEFDRARTGPRLHLARQPTQHQIIRIGYLSGDFYDHPVMHLIAGLFAGHDRKQFHVTALSIGRQNADVFRQRVMDEADDFIDLLGLGDEKLAQSIAEQKIDILVDLKGMTMPLGVLAYRPAPIIASWLGFPGTTGADYVDYLIADPWVIPASARPAYPEAIASLPVSYLLTDDQQPKNPAWPKEKAFPGFAPETCFIGNWCPTAKIQRDVFGAWVTILQRCPHTVLVLKKPRDTVAARYRNHLITVGIDPARLIYGAYFKNKADHFARLGALDLSLDTWLYGCHSTGVDSLWAGVPLLTRRGVHFASRVAEGLLHGVGLRELIAEDTDDYIEKAVFLLNTPNEIQRLKNHLRHPETLPLFQTANRIRDLESLYRQMWQRACDGLPPTDLLTKK